MHRGISLAVPGIAAATAGGLFVEVRRAANAPLPHFDDLDASGRYGNPTGPRSCIRVLGDSSLTGPGLTDGARIWIARLADRLAHDIELVSHARGGSRVGDVLTHQVPVALTGTTDLFVIAVGANDAIHATPARTFARRMRSVVEQLSAVAPVVTLGVGDLSMIPRVPRALRPLLARRSLLIDRLHRAAVAKQPEVVRVPVRQLSDPYFRAAGRSIFAEDLFHPNEEGHALWSELFTPFVRSNLRSPVPAHD